MKSVLASPSFRKNSKPPETQETQKTGGCMPSIFFFFHRHHHSHSRKRLSSASTPGRKDRKPIAEEHGQEKSKKKKSAPPESINGSQEKKVVLKRSGPSDLTRGNASGVESESTPRSPTMVSASRSDSPAVTPRRSSAVVVRLMGLDDIPAVSAAESAAEKRRKLLGALEKCDEDLKALKAIIEALRLTEVRKPRIDCKEEEQPSPVSVLSLPSTSPPAKQAEKRKRGGFSLGATMEWVPWRSMCGRKCSIGTKEKRWTSKGMVESVEEVCKEALLGQRSECRRVAMALEGRILGDLMEEIIGELELATLTTPNRMCSLSSSSSSYLPLPFDSCRRRLRF